MVALQHELGAFVKTECANFNKHYQTCLDDTPCKALTGERCGYFERVVLGPPDYKFRLPNIDYQKLFAQYAEFTNTEAQVVKQRRCACGSPLKPRQRFCDNCVQNRRKQTYRKMRQKNGG